jgi:hypothetical protein
MGIGFAYFCYMEYNGIITHSWLFFYGKRFKLIVFFVFSSKYALFVSGTLVRGKK